MFRIRKDLLILPQLWQVNISTLLWLILSVFKSQVDAGNLKILAVMAASRSEIYPNVPTFKELGHDMTIRAWAALVAPKDTPQEKLEVLRSAAKKVCESKEFKEYFIKQGIDPTRYYWR